MAAKKINLKGTPGQTYNLDEIQKTGTRTDSTRALTVQVWKWNPNLPESNPHSKPNPTKLVIGQMWLSKLVSEEEALAEGLGDADGN